MAFGLLSVLSKVTIASSVVLLEIDCETPLSKTQQISLPSIENSRSFAGTSALTTIDQPNQ